MRQAGEQNRLGDPTCGLWNSPSMLVTVRRPQLAQVKPSRHSVLPCGAEASRMLTWFAVAGLTHPVGLAVGSDDVVVVQQPVQQADGGGVFG